MIDKKASVYTPGQSFSMERSSSRSLKYANIGASILNNNFNTEHIKVLSDKSIVNRKGELFKRIKAGTLAGLIKKGKNMGILNTPLGDFDSISNYGGDPTQRNSIARSVINYQDHLDTETHSKISDLSRVSGVSYSISQLGMNNDTDYLLLDLRERDVYDLYHILGAKHFPGPMITRDKFAPEIYEYRNKIGKLIIIYHQDEKNGSAYAAAMFDKGFENVYLLTGGVENFVQEVPNLLQGKKLPRPEKKVVSLNYEFKRSKFREYPNESEVIIPSNYIIEENKSYVSSMASQVTDKRGKSVNPTYPSKSSPFKSYN